MHRRTFLTAATLTVGTVLVAPTLLAQSDTTNSKPAAPPKPPRIADDLVKGFVAAGHNDLVKVKAMLAEHPNLLYATWDWGGGDFETALEGAGHVGDAEIANYLIEQGARPNLFVLTMLGKTALVKQALEELPSLLNAKGPHGYTLLHHAKRGGDAAAELLAYLESKGLKEARLPLW